MKKKLALFLIVSVSISSKISGMELPVIDQIAQRVGPTVRAMNNDALERSA